ncbi:MAG: OmpH family outer membrane protein [Hyphomicrobiales bacterium]|nr:OmpH family outer membrane protein [Hyphomicrobiales bacterium]
MPLKSTHVILRTLALLAVLAAAAPADAQSIGLAGDQKFAVVDVNVIRQNSSAVKSIQAQLANFEKAFQADIKKEEEALRNAERELTRQRTLLAPDAFAKKRREFEQRVVQVQRLVQQRKIELNRTHTGAMRKVEDALRDVVLELAAKHKITMIFRKDQMIFAVPGMEITETVLKELDKKLPSVKVSQPAKTPQAN